MTRNWEAFERRDVQAGFGASKYGPKWNEVPAIAVTKTYVCLNPKFVEAYVGNSTHCLPVMCTENGHRILGIKIVPRGEERATDCILTKDPKGRSLKIANSRLVRALRDLRGAAFRAMLNMSSNGVIEAELSPQNQLK